MDNPQQKQRDMKNSVLIVDDVQSNIDILKIMLASDYDVFMATNGRDAVNIANEESPDIILLDIIMPDLDGFDVLKILKSNQKTKKIPVIIISGLDNAEGEERALDLEAVDFIHKPFVERIVKIKIRNQMQIVNQIRAIEQYAQEKEITLSIMVELQKKLEAALDDAQTANKAKSAFLARMSHELRTPLNAVIGISEMQLQNHSLAQDARESFIRINNSGDLLLGLINDILDISKIEAGKLELLKVKYDVCKMINDTVYLNTIKHEEKPIEFILNIDENVPSHVLGDEIRIKQILNNLLSNAFKYTAAGEVELSLKAEIAAVTSGSAAGDSDSAETVDFVFNVRDTGQGMTEEELGKIFDDYSRFNLDVNKAITGTGLGMGITRNLTRMMSGEIKAESKKGSGSNFTVRIPQGNVNARPLGKETVEKLKSFRSNFKENFKNIGFNREPIPFGKVLIVDDIDMNLYVTRGLLSPYGLQIDTAMNGLEAIEKIKKTQAINNLYDLVFMDHIMPGMDGIETTKKIRELGPEYEKLPIIMLTANAFTAMRNTLLDDGFNGCLLKPVNIKELDVILKKWISPKILSETGSIKYTESETTEKYEIFKALGGVEEIDVKTGLSNVSDKKDVYLETLGIFLGKLEVECNKMSDFLENDELPNFLISIHSMKTMLAIIGASALSEIAHTLQIASSNHDIDYCRHRFKEFKAKMSVLYDKLSSIFTACKNDFFKPSAAPEIKTDTGEAIVKILIVDDVELILNVMKSNFEIYGFNVDTAASGAEAIEKTEKNTYDIIFMDYRMPEMDGIEAILNIRKREEETNKKQSVIIALTGNESSDKEKTFINNGFNGYLTKPVDRQKLEYILDAYGIKFIRSANL